MLLPILLGSSAMSVKASLMTFDFGSFWASYEVASEDQRPQSPTSVTVRSDGLSIAINPGAPDLFDSGSTQRNSIKQASIPGLWQPSRPDIDPPGVPRNDSLISDISSKNVQDLNPIEAGLLTIDGEPASSAAPEPVFVWLIAISLGLVFLVRSFRPQLSKVRK